MAYQQNQQGFVIDNNQRGSGVRTSGPVVHSYGANYNSGTYDVNNYPEQRSTYAENVNASSHVGRDYQDQRFAGYTKKLRDEIDYKYNIYSILDEPWNRCCNVGKCGTCPGNEGIAKDHTVSSWK